METELERLVEELNQEDTLELVRHLLPFLPDDQWLDVILKDSELRSDGWLRELIERLADKHVEGGAQR